MANEFNISLSPPAFSRWQPAAWLRISGEDAFSFLQGQFTNDLRSVEAGGAVYGLWLNHKGRVIADSFVQRGPAGDFWVGSYFCSGKLIQERLEAFIIADDVLVEDVTAGWRAITLFSDTGVDSLLPAEPGTWSFIGRRRKQAHREFVFPAESETRVLSRLGGMRELSAAEVEHLRIADGIPAVPADIGPGELPNEGGLEAVAISYNKGCYLGQEVMARLKSMGQVRRKLVKVQGTGAVPSLPATIYQEDRRIGELRTAVVTSDGFIGMALLSLLHLRAELGLSFSAQGLLGLTVCES